MGRCCTLAFCLAAYLSCVSAVASEAVQEAENTPKYLTSLGIQALKLGQYDQAIERFNQALKKDKKYFYAHINVALAYQQKQLLDKAKNAYNEALRLRPDTPEAHNNLGFIDFANKDYQSASKRFSTAANMASNLPLEAADYYYNLGTVYEKMRDWLAAQNAYQDAIKLNPQHFHAHFNLGTLYMNAIPNTSLAEQYLTMAHKLDSQRTEPLLNLALIAERTKRGEPLTYLNQSVDIALEGSSQRAQALWHRANYFDRLNPPRKVDMSKDLRSVLEIDQHFPEANGKLGLYYESLAEYKIAIPYLEREIYGEHFNPKSDIDLECHYALALIYTEHIINSAKALKHAKAYYQARPNSLAAHELKKIASRLQHNQLHTRSE